MTEILYDTLHIIKNLLVFNILSSQFYVLGHVVVFLFCPTEPCDWLE